MKKKRIVTLVATMLVMLLLIGLFAAAKDGVDDGSSSGSSSSGSSGSDDNNDDDSSSGRSRGSDDDSSDDDDSDDNSDDDDSDDSRRGRGSDDGLDDSEDRLVGDISGNVAVQKALSIAAGTVEKVERETENGRSQTKVRIIQADGTRVDIRIDDLTNEPARIKFNDGRELRFDRDVSLSSSLPAASLSRDDIVRRALEISPGTVEKIELETRLEWKVRLIRPDGTKVDVRIDDSTNELSRVRFDDGSEFRSDRDISLLTGVQASLTRDDVIRQALQESSGTIEKVELEMGSNGRTEWKVRIVENGVRTDLRIDDATGQVVRARSSDRSNSGGSSETGNAGSADDGMQLGSEDSRNDNRGFFGSVSAFFSSVFGREKGSDAAATNPADPAGPVSNPGVTADDSGKRPDGPRENQASPEAQAAGVIITGGVSGPGYPTGPLNIVLSDTQLFMDRLGTVKAGGDVADRQYEKPLETIPPTTAQIPVSINGVANVADEVKIISNLRMKDGVGQHSGTIDIDIDTSAAIGHVTLQYRGTATTVATAAGQQIVSKGTFKTAKTTGIFAGLVAEGTYDMTVIESAQLNGSPVIVSLVTTSP